MAKWAWGKNLAGREDPPGLISTDPIEQEYEMRHNERLARMDRPKPRPRKY
jgi:hypothetical protein